MGISSRRIRGHPSVNVMSTRIELLPDYSAHPLWTVEPGTSGPLDPRRLPLRPQTLARLLAWSDKYDAQLDLNDPVNSPFLDGPELYEFEAEGIRLWLLLRGELSPDYEVGYFSQILQKHLRHPDELRLDLGNQ